MLCPPWLLEKIAVERQLAIVVNSQANHAEQTLLPCRALLTFCLIEVAPGGCRLRPN
jgi:hypothetical protein